MFREFLTSSDLLHFPVIALVIFFLVFVVVALRTLVGSRKSSTLSRMAALPLEDEESNLNEEVR